MKRARLAKVHAHIIGHLKNEMPALFGKESKQAELIANLATEFRKVHKAYHLPPGDFPDLEKYAHVIVMVQITNLCTGSGRI